MIQHTQTLIMPSSAVDLVQSQPNPPFGAPFQPHIKIILITLSCEEGFFFTFKIDPHLKSLALEKVVNGILVAESAPN
jgi:hypothetical protein